MCYKSAPPWKFCTPSEILQISNKLKLLITSSVYKFPASSSCSLRIHGTNSSKLKFLTTGSGYKFLATSSYWLRVQGTNFQKDVHTLVHSWASWIIEYVIKWMFNTSLWSIQTPLLCAKCVVYKLPSQHNGKYIMQAIIAIRIFL